MPKVGGVYYYGVITAVDEDGYFQCGESKCYPKVWWPLNCYLNWSNGQAEFFFED